MVFHIERNKDENHPAQGSCNIQSTCLSVVKSGLSIVDKPANAALQAQLRVAL